MRDFSTSVKRKVPIVGLTGGMGSGKSTLAKVFENFGIPVFAADEAAKALYAPGSQLLDWIAEHIGQDCVERNAHQAIGVNKHLLADRIFQQPDQLQALNEQVHPRVRQAFIRWLEQIAIQSNPPYVMREAAILFESGSDEDCDQIITVQAPEAIRCQRVHERSGLSTAAIQRRMQQQWTDEERAVRSDFVVLNDVHDALLPQALKIHEALLERFCCDSQQS